MTVACDFCLTPADRDDDRTFLAAPSGLVHICDECVALAAQVLADRRENHIDSLRGTAYHRDTARRANPSRKAPP